MAPIFSFRATVRLLTPKLQILWDLGVEAMARWTIRDVPDEWDRLVNRLATEHARTKNEELLAIFDTAISHQKPKAMDVDKVLAIARRSAESIRENGRDINMDDELYDENGLPK